MSDKWMTIDSAPKDGQWAIVGCWVTHESGTREWSFWMEPLDDGPRGCDGRYGDECTHYLPDSARYLPPAPKDASHD